MADTGRCSVASALRKESLAGSAPVARRWVLVEHPGPWAREALDTPPLAGPVAERFEEALATHHARLLLIRRTGRQPEETEPRHWFVVDTHTGDSITGTWLRERDFDAVLTALATINGPFAEPAPPLTLVCTHGVRDACCAIRGRPIVGMLAREFDGEVWECSHLSGHRFAGTALVLPDGACYGRLDQADAVRVVRDHREGRVDAEHLRGLTSLTPPAQVAHAWALGELARTDPEAPRAIDEVEVGTVGDEDGEGVTRVEVHGLRPDDAPLKVRVRRVELDPAPLSCGTPEQVATGYEVVESRVLNGVVSHPGTNPVTHPPGRVRVGDGQG